MDTDTITQAPPPAVDVVAHRVEIDAEYATGNFCQITGLALDLINAAPAKTVKPALYRALLVLVGNARTDDYTSDFVWRILTELDAVVNS